MESPFAEYRDAGPGLWRLPKSSLLVDLPATHAAVERLRSYPHRATEYFVRWQGARVRGATDGFLDQELAASTANSHAQSRPGHLSIVVGG
jgi:hypothetical protein